MKFSFEHRIYIALVLGLILLFSSLIIGYSNIQRNNQLLTQLDRNQIKLNHYTNQLNYDIKNTQVILLQELLLHHHISDETKTFQKIDKYIQKLEKYATNQNIFQEYLKVLHKIKKRLISYQLVRKSLIEAINSKDTIDIQDAIIGFNSISLKFTEDTQKLTDLANAELYQKLITIQMTNKNSSNLLIFSFSLATLLLGIAFYKFHILQTNLQMQLARAKKAENELKNSEMKLLLLNFRT